MNAEARTREALEWALKHTRLAIPHGLHTAAGWQWDADDVQLRAVAGDGHFRFHVAAERRRKLKVRIAVLSWEDDDGSATWEAEMPDEGRFAEDGSYASDPWTDTLATAPAPAAEGRE